MDTVLILLSAPLSLPVAALTAAAVAVRLGRPVIYRQVRIGLDERPFSLYKFRTMTQQCGPDGKLLADVDRLTPLGRSLRRLSLDELPQLLNVLTGEMSLVGPRPLYPEYLAWYEPCERARHSVRPGITGLAQASGRNNLLWNERLALDIRYAKSLGLMGDVRIFLKTIARGWGGTGVHVVAGESGERLDVARAYPRASGYTMRRLEHADVTTRVAWMNAPITRAHMAPRASITVQSTHEWLRASRATSGRFDFAVTRVGSDEPVAMMGLAPRAGEVMPEMYVFVDPNMHGNGVGTASMTLLLEWLHSRDEPKGFWLTVATENARAVQLYRRLGFRTVSVSREKRLRMSYVRQEGGGSRGACGSQCS